MTEQRNFRSAYLEKVGIKGVEEKKSLEILLKEQPLNIIKLNQFCIRFPVPASYRPYLWKVLLGTIHLIIARFCLLTNSEIRVLLSLRLLLAMLAEARLFQISQCNFHTVIVECE